MKKSFIAGTLFLGILAAAGTLALAVQDPADLEIGQLLGLQEGLMAMISTVFGLGILGITSLVKGLYKDKIADWQPWARHAVTYVVTAVLSAGVSYFALIKTGSFTWVNLGLATVWTWGVANGIWKGLKANRGGGS